jgi:hypothetical protein
MSTTPKAIKATFADWRPVKGRKQLQLIFEVPLEETSEVLKMLGAPMPDKETWVAIALLDMRTFDDQGNLQDPAQKHRRAFCDMPFPQQAGILSEDQKFETWALSHIHLNMDDTDCAAVIRRWCGVTTRADILPGTHAGGKWINLLRSYERGK